MHNVATPHCLLRCQLTGWFQCPIGLLTGFVTLIHLSAVES
jgi:hypothetical protein